MAQKPPRLDLSTRGDTTIEWAVYDITMETHIGFQGVETTQSINNVSRDHLYLQYLWEISTS